MGTADELAIDVLINMLSTFSKEYIGIKTLIVGGENASWPVPGKKKPGFTDDPQFENIIKRVENVRRYEPATDPEDVDLLDTKPYFDDLIGGKIDFE